MNKVSEIYGNKVKSHTVRLWLDSIHDSSSEERFSPDSYRLGMNNALDLITPEIIVAFDMWKNTMSYVFDRHVDGQDYWMRMSGQNNIPCGTTMELFDKFLSHYKIEISSH